MTTMKSTQNGGVSIDHDLHMESECDEEEPVVLGLDGGTTSTICVCMPLLPISNHHLPDPLPVLGRAIAGCSNHNSVGANKNWDIGQKVVDRLMKIYPGAFPVRPKVEPAVGAALLACNFLMKEKEKNRLT